MTIAKAGRIARNTDAMAAAFPVVYCSTRCAVGYGRARSRTTTGDDGGSSESIYANEAVMRACCVTRCTIDAGSV